MSFLNAWAIWMGALTIGVPVLIHWMTKPRPVRMPLSTIRFVQEAIRQRQARHRLRDFLILALRTLAILLFAAAIGRPLIGNRPLISTSGIADSSRIVILDVSQSMAAGKRGASSLQRAKARAGSFLKYRPGLDANLVRAGAQAQPVFPTLSRNFASLREQLSSMEARPERLNAQLAIEAAADLLANAKAPELVIVSDFQRDNWSRVNFDVLPAETLIQFESTADEGLENVAILNVQVDGRPAVGREVRLEIEVGNFSSQARRPDVEVSVGTNTFRLQDLCPPRARITLTKNIQLPKEGWLAGDAKLLDSTDALANDDARQFVLRVNRSPRYAIVSRDARTKKGSAAYFLRRAFAPYANTDGEATRGVSIDHIAPARLTPESLAGTDLVAIVRPGRLNTAKLKQLADQLRRGRSILYVASELSDAVNMREFINAYGTGLQPPVELVPRGQGDRGSERFLSEVKQKRRPFKIFGEQTMAMIGSLRFSGGLTTRRIEGTLDDDILATYSDRSTCLFVTDSGAGKLAVLNADLNASNLPVSPAFVPFVGELAELLLSGQESSPRAFCGEPFVARLPTDIQSDAGLMAQVQPSGADPGQLETNSDGVIWKNTSPSAPGVYQVRRDEETIFATAMTIPAEESDLRPLSADVMVNRLCWRTQSLLSRQYSRSRFAGAFLGLAGDWLCYVHAGGDRCVSMFSNDIDFEP